MARVQSQPLKTHKHLFERVCALENILAASREALKNGKRAKPPGARYFAELETQAVRLRRELLAGTYRHGGYTYFTVHEPKQRQIAAASAPGSGTTRASGGLQLVAGLNEPGYSGRRRTGGRSW